MKIAANVASIINITNEKEIDNDFIISSA